MKNVLNYIIDTLIAILFFALAFIGILLGFFIPKGSEAPGYEKYLWGLHRHSWGDLHLYISLAFIVLVLLHIILHWDWLMSCTRRRFPRSFIVWILIVLAASVLLVWGGAKHVATHQYTEAGQQPGRQQRMQDNQERPRGGQGRMLEDEEQPTDRQYRGGREITEP